MVFANFQVQSLSKILRLKLLKKQQDTKIKKTASIKSITFELKKQNWIGVDASFIVMCLLENIKIWSLKSAQWVKLVYFALNVLQSIGVELSSLSKNGWWLFY